MAGIFVLSLAYVISHFYRSFLAVLSPALEAELGISPAQLSDALGAWFVAFALSQFLVGYMLDRFGPRYTVAILFSVCAGGGGLLFASAASHLHVNIAMVLLGIGCSPILMASVFIFKRSFDARKFAMLTSINIAVGLGGNILGSSPLAWAMAEFGWRSVMMGLSIVTLALSALVLALVKDPPVVKSETSRAGGYFDILRLRELWFILPLIFFNYAVVGGLRGSWAGPYLNLVHGLSAAAIGTATLWMAIAMTVGSFAYGPLDQLFNSRKRVVLAGSACTLIALSYWTLNPSASATSVTAILIAIGLFSMTYGITMAHATANIPAHLAGRGVTLINFFNMGGVGVMQWASSSVYRKAETTADPVSGFNAVLWLYLACFAGALLIYLFSRDAKPRPE